MYQREDPSEGAARVRPSTKVLAILLPTLMATDMQCTCIQHIICTWVNGQYTGGFIHIHGSMGNTQEGLYIYMGQWAIHRRVYTYTWVKIRSIQYPTVVYLMPH